MLVIAHRGASATAPENTPEAFRLAETHGADGVELDVRQAATGALVVRHDPLPPELDREPAGLIELDTAVASMNDRTLVNVEIKNLASDGHADPTMTMVDPLLEVLRAAPGWPDRWLVTSFSAATIDAVRAAAVEIRTARLCLVADDALIERTARRGHAGVNPLAGGLDRGVVERCHDAGLVVGAWTCNEPDRIVSLAEMGVDAVITDVPAVAVDALASAGVSRPSPATWGTRV